MPVITKVFKNTLVVSPFGDGTFWYLREPLTWIGVKDQTITVPRGFVTDFASVPRPVWWLFPRWAKYGSAAVVHDWLYWSQPFSRKIADLAIKEGMEDMGVSPSSVWMIYRTLRISGGKAWRGNAKAKQAGRKRCIREFPTDPLTTWQQHEPVAGVECGT